MPKEKKKEKMPSEEAKRKTGATYPHRTKRTKRTKRPKRTHRTEGLP